MGWDEIPKQTRSVTPFMAIRHTEHNLGGESLGKLSVMCQNYMGNGIAYTMKHAPDTCQQLIQQSLQITDDLKQTNYCELDEIVLKLNMIFF